MSNERQAQDAARRPALAAALNALDGHQRPARFEGLCPGFSARARGEDAGRAATLGDDDAIVVVEARDLVEICVAETERKQGRRLSESKVGTAR